MSKPPMPANETERLERLRYYEILDTPPEEAFDELVRLASYICGSPIALINLIDSDRQWTKARIGLEVSEVKRDQTFCAHAINNAEQVMIVPDALQDERFAHNPFVEQAPNIRFYAGAPLVSDGYAIGTLCVIDHKPRQLTQEQIEALEILSRRVVAELELRQDMRRLQREIEARKKAEQALQAAREWLDKEIQIAVQIQNSMTPKWAPNLQGFEFAAKNIPARFLSGDFYDFIDVNNHTTQVVLGDIAGKGIPAALLTLSMRTLIRDESNPFPFAVTPADVLNEVNKERYAEFPEMEFFVTLFIAQIDCLRSRFSYASAGHGEALLWIHAKQELDCLAATGLPIGVMEDERYQEHAFIMRPGDVAVIFSDGITEARNLKEEQFGLRRLMDVVTQSAALPAPEIINKIEAALLEFSEGHEQDDDISALVVKALPQKFSAQETAMTENLDKMTAWVKEKAAIYSEEFAYEFELAASEVLTNIIRYAEKQYGLLIELSLDENGIALEIFDQNEPFDPDTAPPPNLDEAQESGYGLFIVRQMLDEFTCKPNAFGGNHWRLAKKLSSQGRKS